MLKKFNRLFSTSVLLFICQIVSAQGSVFNIMDYGSVNDGKTVNTRSIQKAIDDCADKGGGTKNPVSQI